MWLPVPTRLNSLPAWRLKLPDPDRLLETPMGAVKLAEIFTEAGRSRCH